MTNPTPRMLNESSEMNGENEDEHLCPVCFGPMDETDYRLFPCPCGFQVGRFRIQVNE